MLKATLFHLKIFFILLLLTSSIVILGSSYYSVSHTNFSYLSLEILAIILALTSITSIYLVRVINQRLATLLKSITYAARLKETSAQLLDKSNAEIDTLSGSYNTMLSEIKNLHSNEVAIKANIEKISQEMNLVLLNNDYSKRIENINQDHITPLLTDALNELLEKIQLTSNLQFSVAQELSRGVSLDEISYKILELICVNLKWEMGVLWLVAEPDANLKLQNAWGQDKALEKFIKKSNSFPQTQMELLNRAMTQTTPSWFKHVLSNPSLQPIHKENHIHDCICFAINFNDEIYGVIQCFNRQHQRKLGSDTLNLLSTLGNYLGGFMHRINTQEHINTLNKDLVKVSRLAGMSEVATSVLHNVGNVLNSVNISGQVLNDTIHELKLDRLKSIVQLLQTHSANLGEFLTVDKSGKKILTYLDLLANEWSASNDKLSNEITQINKNINTIKNIISSQQSVNKIVVVNEPTFVADIINDAYNIYENDMRSYNINATHEDHIASPILIDKFKVEQIIINLVHNAIDALSKVSHANKFIRIRSILDSVDNTIIITVSDNGEGISNDNLHKIFSFGFTTKPTGHGFGLHNCILSASEMGGTLIVESGGPGLGATFTLKVPIKIKHPINLGVDDAISQLPTT